MPQTLKIIQSAFEEMSVQPIGQPVSEEDAVNGLDMLNRIIDQWDAQREKIYNVTFSRFTLVPNLAPHTIGPSGTFNISQRPVRLISAAVILTASGSDVEYPIEIWNDQQWADVRIKNLASNISRAVYYSPDIPLGNLYFWPVPTSVNDVRLETWTNLTQPATLQDVLQLPPGYWQALVVTLALHLCSSYRVEPTPSLLSKQKEAMRAITGNNSRPPLITTDAGMGSPKRTGRPDFYFPTGEPW